jgi:hypothetical protein
VDPIRPTARGCCLGGFTASALPRPGHRSPVGIADGRCAHAFDRADEEIHRFRSSSLH